MHSFKKSVIGTLLFLTGAVIISIVCLYTYFNTSFEYYQDINVRDRLTGQIDTLYIGSSRGLCAFDSEIIDKELGGRSYNLSGSALSPTGKIAIIKEEINRNKVKNVIIDIEEDDLFYRQKNWRSEGEINLIPRLRETGTRVSYFFENVRFEDYLYLYSVWMNSGTKALLNTVVGKDSSDGSYQTDVRKNKSADVFLSEDEISKGMVEQGECLILPECYDKITELINICQEKNINVYLVILPNSENLIWTSQSNESMLSAMKKLADSKNCLIFDFNLIKNRSLYFSDHYSFSDYMHMSENGVEAFSDIYSQIMQKVENGEDVSDMFYDSYDEAIKHFEYYEIYQKLMQEQK